MRKLTLWIALLCAIKLCAEPPEWLINAAKQGDIDSQMELGGTYYDEGNYAQALKWFLAAARQGDAEAQFNVAAFYHNGIGTTRDYEEALYWYENAAMHGIAQAQHNAGVLYDAGLGVTQNYEEAFKWFQMAASQGLAESQYNVGMYYALGHGVPQDMDKSVEWLRRAAAQGNVHAYAPLGMALAAYGQYREAIPLLSQSCSCDYALNSANACHFLAQCYYWGFGVEKDRDEAKRIWEKSRRKKDALNGLSDLAFLYHLDGKEKEAIKLWEEDIKLVSVREKGIREGTIYMLSPCGNPKASKAKSNLGCCYFFGQGVPESNEKALSYWREAANEGFAIAQYNLAYCYQYGHGVKKDLNKAKEWYCKAYSQGLKNWVLMDDSNPLDKFRTYDDYTIAKKHYLYAKSQCEGTSKGDAPSPGIAGPDLPCGVPIPGDPWDITDTPIDTCAECAKEKCKDCDICGDCAQCEEVCKNSPRKPNTGGGGGGRGGKKHQEPLPPCKYITIIGDQVTVLDSCPELVPPVSSFDTQDMISINMVLVPAGTFQMGCTEGQGTNCVSNERPAHQVTLDTFYISQTEVTQALWEKVMGVNPSAFKQGGNYPVEKISWNDCQDFVLKLNAMTGLQFALPTEAQWEYAARGGMIGDVVDYMYAGSNEVDEIACYKDGSEHFTMPVGYKTPNSLNLFDISGNVMEWCSDKMGNYSQQPQINPTGVLDGSNNVLRGGCWNMPAQNCRVTFRYGSNPMYKVNTFGLRLVLIP